ncbi:MAG: class I adenylate-forming enzyme family protein [Actinomycetota bacterium]
MTRPLVAVVRTRSGDLLADIHAAWDDGAAVLPLDPRWSPERIAAVARVTGASTLVTDAGAEDLAGQPAVSDDTAVVLLTSGTSGEPKPVALSSRALKTAADLVHERIGAGVGDRWLCCVPLFHVAGFAMIARSQALATPLEVHDRFDADAVAASNADLVSLVPTQLHRLLDAGVDLTRFDRILLGGSAVPRALLDRARATGARIVRTYGMTETCGGVVYDGVPLRSVEVRAAHDGVLEISSPTLMEGYVGDPGLTADRLRDGWFRTNDLGRVSDGVVTVEGRADDIIISGGEKISPQEVRAELLEHPGIDDAAVVGYPHPEWGEAVGAVIEGSVTSAEVDAWLRERLPSYKVPKRLTVAPVPRNAMGKPDAVAARDLLSAPGASS